MMPMVSVVVIGRNEGARLERCLRSIEGMRVEGFTTELIYVDSGSTDGSLALATGFGAQAMALHSRRPTAALGRNAGWRAAKGDFILFLDGDTVLDREFVVEALRSFGDATCAVVWGHRRELFPRATLFNRVLDLDWVYPAGRALFCGGDALVRRTVLEVTGGFDDTLIAGEEPELCRRIVAGGSTVWHIDAPMTGHDLAMTRFSQYWKRATRAGHAFAEVSSRFSGTPDPFWLLDARRNRNRAWTLIAIPLAALLAVVIGRSAWPMLLLAGLLVLLVLRTAWKARWKSGDRVALLLYGVHSHLQQIPIYVGQVRFLLNRRAGRREGLVEYKH